MKPPLPVQVFTAFSVTRGKRRSIVSTARFRTAGLILCVVLYYLSISTTSLLAAELPTLVATSDFSSGSGVVENIDQKTRVIRLVPSEHIGRGWVCWWYVKISGIKPGETVTIDMGEAPWATPDRAAFSLDNKTWKQTLPGKGYGKRMAYQQKVDADVAWFAWGPPFTVEDAATLVKTCQTKCEFAKPLELCRSLENRPVPALRVSQPTENEGERFGIWVNARQHAWETGGSWVCCGFTEWLVSKDPFAEALRKKSVIHIVPIVDVDNVAIGAGGKEQKPQDHNRDWTDKPHFPATQIVQNKIKEFDANGHFDLFVDLHNPGPNDRTPVFYISPRDILTSAGASNLDRFVKIARQEMTGPLTYKGETRESGPNYDKRWEVISKNWVTKNTRPHSVSVTLETCWNTPNSTADGYRQLGKELGLAIERYFRTSPRVPAGK